MVPLPSSLANDLVRIHKVITRSINIGLSKGKEHIQAGFPTPDALRGFSSYLHCLTSVLSSHHQSEDEIAFPEFNKVLPLAPYAQLTAEHHQVEQLLAKTPIWINELAGDNPREALKNFLAVLEELSELWFPHIAVEEKYFSNSVLMAVLSVQEQARISAATSKHSQEHSGPPYWVVPFILYNLDRDERVVMASFLPPEITDELVPVVWKDQWAPMKPYLLE